MRFCFDAFYSSTQKFDASIIIAEFLLDLFIPATNGGENIMVVGPLPMIWNLYRVTNKKMKRFANGMPIEINLNNHLYGRSTPWIKC